MGKNKIRLTESQLHKVIEESVKRVLREGRFYPNLDDYEEQEMLEQTEDFIRHRDMDSAEKLLDRLDDSYWTLKPIHNDWFRRLWREVATS